MGGMPDELYLPSCLRLSSLLLTGWVTQNNSSLYSLVKAGSFQVPALIADIGPEATKRYLEFFTVPIRNKNTRIAYYHAIGQFLVWCHRAGFRDLGILSRSRWRPMSNNTQARRQLLSSICPRSGDPSQISVRCKT
jgi:hypothetical protein